VTRSSGHQPSEQRTFGLVERLDFERGPGQRGRLVALPGLHRGLTAAIELGQRIADRRARSVGSAIGLLRRDPLLAALGRAARRFDLRTRLVERGAEGGVGGLRARDDLGDLGRRGQRRRLDRGGRRRGVGAHHLALDRPRRERRITLGRARAAGQRRKGQQRDGGKTAHHRAGLGRR